MDFWNITLLIIAFLGVTIAFASRWAILYFGDLTFDEMLFQLSTPLGGTNHGVFVDLFRQVFLPVFIIYVPLAFLTHWAQLQVMGTHWLFAVFAGVSMAIGLSVAEYFLHPISFLRSQMKKSTYIDDNYVDPKTVDIAFPEQKRNLIHIFVESLESTYMSKQDGGAMSQDVIVPMTKIAKEHVSFSHQEALGGAHAATGSTFTTGGMLAQHGGLPAKAYMTQLFIGKNGSFLPGGTTLGDILLDNGYRNVLLIGSIAKFGGRRYLYEQHGDYEIRDYGWAKEKGYIPKDYRVWWGYEDERLFDIAKDTLRELAAGPMPFHLTMLTADTHAVDGYKSEANDTRFPDQYSNVLSGSAKQVAAFIEWMQEQPFYENTTVVVTGDHTTMNYKTIHAYLKGAHRGVYNAFLNPVLAEDITEDQYKQTASASSIPTPLKNRMFTTMDYFPTILASIGVSIEGDRLALGTNLFSNTPTLSEERGGYEDNDKDILHPSDFYRKILMR